MPPPRVSVVIPTYRRPDLVTRAVADAAAQTVDEIEIIVVVDGLDVESVRAVEGLGDARTRVVIPPRNLGNAGARNLGIAEARGAWIALLDDDDGWHPDKLALQLAAGQAAQQAGHVWPVVSCRLTARSETRDFVWPRRLPRPGEAVPDYLFCRRSPRTGEGMVQTSTILAPRRLFEAVPFDASLTRYVDLDWVIRASHAEGFALVFAGDGPLVLWSIDEGRTRISNESDWHFDRDWIRARRHLVSPRAYGAFLLTLASIRARRAGDRRAAWPLLSEALREGRISAGELAFHLGNVLLPASARQHLAGGETRAGERGD